MKYYIVALFDDNSYESITPIQRNISKKFRANRNSPMPYIALEIIDNPNIENLYAVIEKIIKPYKKFKIELCDDISVNDSMKTVNLSIVNEGYIKKLSRTIRDTLSLHGIYTVEPELKDLSISIANVNSVNKDNKKNSSDVACELIQKNGKNLTLKVNTLEIWKISNNKKETAIKSYQLRSF